MRFGDSVNSLKQVGRHWPNISNEGTEVQMSQNLGFDVDAGRDLDRLITMHCGRILIHRCDSLRWIGLLP